MQSFRVEKTTNRKSSKPAKSWNIRRHEIADALSSSDDNIAMVACSECVDSNSVCYYDREQSVKCAECLRHQRECDGTFSLEEFRKVGVQKKRFETKAREHRLEVARRKKKVIEARKARMEADAVLAAAESSAADAELEETQFQDEVARLNELSHCLLRREMLALGVMEPLDNEQEVALAEPDFVWAGAPVTDSIDWSVVLGDSPAQVPG
jgi:hypothetical protein